MAYNFYKTPTQQELEALNLIKAKQAVDAGNNKQDFFDSVGASNPSIPGQPGQATQFSPMQLQQLTANNLTNPNQIQGSFNNAGLAIGSMLSKMFGPKNQPQVDPVQAEEGLRAKAAMQVMQLIKQNIDPVEASRRVAVDLMKAGADKGDPVFSNLGMKLFDQYQDMAKKKQDIDKFTPKNMMGPDGIMTTATTPEQMADLVHAKFTLAGETPANPDVREVPVGTSVYTQQLDRATGKWNTIAIGQRAQLTGDLPKGIEAKRQDEYSHSIAAINGVVDLKDSIIKNMNSSELSGSAPGRAIVNAVGGIVGTVKALAPEIGSNSSLYDEKNYKDILTEHHNAIVASGLNDAAFIRLATMLAAQEKFTDGEANKTSVADVKLKLESIGGHLGDPKTVRAVLEDVVQGSVKDLGNKIDSDLAFDSYKWAPGVRRRYKQLQDRVSGTPDDMPASVRDILDKHRAKVNATD